MQRMRCLFARAGLLVVLTVVLGTEVSAELIQSPGGRAYPDLAGAITGTQQYTYHPSTQTGTLQVTNTPFLLTTGPSTANEVVVQPNADGMRSQVLNLKLDPNGRLVSDPGNSYSLYGTVVVDGKTFQGLLLQATPTAFGAQSGATASFNLDLKVTGGELARTFGPSVYMEFHSGGDSTFDGSFARSFTTKIDSSNTLGYKSPVPAPVPEPTTLVVLLAGGVWLAVFHRRRRLRRASNDSYHSADEP
jgi:hypothetical protein